MFKALFDLHLFVTLAQYYNLKSKSFFFVNDKWIGQNGSTSHCTLDYFVGDTSDEHPTSNRHERLCPCPHIAQTDSNPRYRDDDDDHDDDDASSPQQEASSRSMHLFVCIVVALSLPTENPDVSKNISLDSRHIFCLTSKL